MRKTIYISGAITEKPDYKKMFDEAKNEIIDLVRDGEMDYTGIISPVEVCGILPADFLYEDYMRVDRCLLSLCQGIYMLRDYEQSAGACQELRMARELGLTVHFQD